MAAHSISREERDALLRDARGGSHGARIPVRTSKSRDTGGGSGHKSPSGSSSAGRGDGTLEPPRRRRWPFGSGGKRVRRAALWVVVIVALLTTLGVAKFLNVGSAVLSHERPVIGQLIDLLFRHGMLKGEAEGRVNILLLAEGGEGHAGENLTDTIMFASFRPAEKDVALLSIPRDLYVKIPDTELSARINAVHAYGESQRKDQGLRLMKRKMGEMTGLPIHYVSRVDFLAFKKLVDQIGGIDIAINNSFYDFWHKISFPAGTEHMNGDRALAYVRARYIEGPEGGDFKRAERTQQVLLAIRTKVFSVQTAVDLRALAGILDTLKQHVATDFTLSELKRLSDLTRGISEDHIRTAVLITGPDGLLAGTTEILGGRPASVLRPRKGFEQYDEIRAFALNIFTEGRLAPLPSAGQSGTGSGGGPSITPSATPGTPAPTTTVENEQPTVDIRNGTVVTGFASRVAKALEKQKFTIASVGNAAARNRTKTVVVDRTDGKKPASLQALQDLLGVSTVVAIPSEEKVQSDANFIILLGTDVVGRFKK